MYLKCNCTKHEFKGLKKGTFFPIRVKETTVNISGQKQKNREIIRIYEFFSPKIIPVSHYYQFDLTIIHIDY